MNEWMDDTMLTAQEGEYFVLVRSFVHDDDDDDEMTKKHKAKIC